MKKTIVFVGNPGVGKSALLNCLVERPYFKSGVKIGSGISYKLDEVTVSGVTYMDTPGLQDIEMRESASRAISEALQKGGTYRIAFVITLEAGRVKAEDVATLKLILKSAPDITKYAIIVNKLSNKMLVDLTNSNEKRSIIAKNVTGNSTDSQTMLLLPRRTDLDGKENAVVSLPELGKFVEALPSITINRHNVCQISLYDEHCETYRKECEEFEREVQRLQLENERLQRQAMEEQRRQQIEAKKRAERLEREFQEKRAREERYIQQQEEQLQRERRAREQREQREQRERDELALQVLQAQRLRQQKEKEEEEEREERRLRQQRMLRDEELKRQETLRRIAEEQRRINENREREYLARQREIDREREIRRRKEEEGCRIL